MFMFTCYVMRRWSLGLDAVEAAGALKPSTVLVVGGAASKLAAAMHEYRELTTKGEIGSGKEWQAVLLTAATVPSSSELYVVSVALDMAQTLAAMRSTPPVWMCTLSTQAVSVSTSRPGSSHAQLWGLGRACRQEIATLPAWCVDLRADDAYAIEQLARLSSQGTLQLSAGVVRGLHASASIEPEAASHGAALYVPRLVTPFETDASNALVLSFASVCHGLDAHTTDEMKSLDMPRLAHAYALLESLCQKYMRDALGSLEGAAAAVPVWHHKLLYAWCAQHAPPPADGSEALLSPADVCAAHPDLWAEVQLAERCGPRLADALSSTVKYQELLFPGGSMEAVLPVYESAVAGAFYNRCVVAAIRVAMRQLGSEHRPLVALEVGAGTGGTASSVLPVLDGSCECYIFTDVSEVFLRTTRKRFTAYTFIQYSLLNIDADPRVQGFASHACDFVIATNVLHATPFMRNTLRHCRQLLRASGLLVVNELLNTHAFAQITFGMTDGWWLFSEVGDPERIGQGSPLLSWQQWASLLAGCGFQRSHCMRGDRFLSCQAVLVAQAAERPAAKARSTIRDEATYMLSGGLGGLGLLTARLLIERGARKIVLSSRSDRVQGGSEEDWARLAGRVEASAADGVHVLLRRVRCDASDVLSVRTSTRALVGEGLRLEGVFHAAHALADAALANQTAFNFASAFAPKVDGAKALHAAGHLAAFRFFSVYSSIAGLMGSAGQAPHSAANTWLDAMAGLRLRLGVCGQSISWGAVASVGYAARHGADRRAEASGIGAISLSMTFAALSSMLQPASRSFAVLPADWGKLLAGSSDARGFLAPYAHLQRERKSTAPAPKAVKAHAAAVAPASSAVSLEAVLDMVHRTAGGSADADAPLMEGGLDSLGAVELRNQLQQAAGEGMALPSTLVFDHPTARQLAASLSSDEGAPELAPIRNHRADDNASSQVYLTYLLSTLPGGVCGESAAWGLAAASLATFTQVPAARWDVVADAAHPRYAPSPHHPSSHHPSLASLILLPHPVPACATAPSLPRLTSSTTQRLESVWPNPPPWIHSSGYCSATATAPFTAVGSREAC